VQIALIVHAGRDASIAAAADAHALLTSLGVDVITGETPADCDPADTAVIVTKETDLAISFGGDGTFLRAARLCRDIGVPLLGVNLGRLGFLAEVERDDLHTALHTVVEHGFTTEQRATLEAVIADRDGNELHRTWALNEIAVEKSVRQRLLQMDVQIDGTFLARVPADALLLSTPTGSTAYALSAGGPIVSPRLDVVLVVPVAPHSLFDRSIIASPREPIRVDLIDDVVGGLVSSDGRDPFDVPAGGSVTVTGGGRPVLFARVGLLDFPSRVRRKFGLR
jgi:NAD+ kinase